MTTQPPASASTPCAEGTFGFFGTLPRELRDSIYDLLQELDAKVESLRFQSRIICTAARLVSRQFKFEYDERTSVDKRYRQLTVTICRPSRPCWCNVGITLPSPQLAARVTDLTIVMDTCDGAHVNAACHGCEGEVFLICGESPMEALENALPYLQSIHFRLHTACDICFDSILYYAEIDHFSTFRRPIEVSVVSPHPKERFTAAPVLIRTWEMHGGQWQDHEALEYHQRRFASIA